MILKMNRRSLQAFQVSPSWRFLWFIWTASLVLCMCECVRVCVCACHSCFPTTTVLFPSSVWLQLTKVWFWVREHVCKWKMLYWRGSFVLAESQSTGCNSVQAMSHWVAMTETWVTCHLHFIFTVTCKMVQTGRWLDNEVNEKTFAANLISYFWWFLM